MTSIGENERNGDETLGDDKQGYEEYTAWESPSERYSRLLEPSYERFIRNLDAVANVSKWSAIPQSFADTASAAQRSVENIQRLHQSVTNDFRRDLGAMMSALDSSASLRAIPPGLDAMQRQHDQMMTALGYIKVRRRRYAQPTPARPRTPLPPAAQPPPLPPMVTTCELDAADVTPQKRGRGRRPGHRTISETHFDRLMCAYCVEKSKTPSRREFQVFAALKYKTVDRRRLTDYANDYCQTDWAGVRLLYGQKFGVE